MSGNSLNKIEYFSVVKGLQNAEYDYGILDVGKANDPAKTKQL
jgi:hypothetical protein